MTSRDQEDHLRRVLELHDPVEPIAAERLARLAGRIESRLASVDRSDAVHSGRTRPMRTRMDGMRWPAGALAIVMLGFVAGQWMTAAAHRNASASAQQGPATAYALLESPWQKWFE